MRKISAAIILMFLFISNVFFVSAESGKSDSVNWIEGPVNVEIGNNLARLNIPREFLFANANDTKKIMSLIGNLPSGNEYGSVHPKTEKPNWYVLIEYNKVGHVPDEDAGGIDAREVLDSIKSATEQENSNREAKDFEKLEVIGWDEEPHYDQSTKNLTWSILANDGKDEIVNYNVRILGRIGYTSMTLVVSKGELEKIKPSLNRLISAFEYKEGSRYSDYVEGTDKVAEYGIAALIAGSAASKFGFLAKILLVFKKIWFLLAAVAIGFFKKVFGSSSNKSEEVNYSNTQEQQILIEDNKWQQSNNNVDVDLDFVPEVDENRNFSKGIKLEKDSEELLLK